MQSPSKQPPKELPLRLVFEGQSWRLTTLIHTTIAICLVLLLHDRKQYLFGDIPRDDWTQEFLFYLGCMFTATWFGAFAVGVLSLNLRPVEHHNWRARSCRSIFALVLLDIMAIDTISFAFRVCTLSEKVVSIPATMFMTCMAIFFTVAFNVMYVRLFGCCICCCCCSEEASAAVLERAKKVDYRRNHLPVGHAASASTVLTTEYTNSRELPLHSESSVQNQDASVELDDGVGADQTEPKHSLVVETTKNVEGESRKERSYVQEQQTNRETRSSSIDSGKMRAVEEPTSPTPPRERVLGRWDTMKLVEVGSHKLSTERSLEKAPRKESSKECEIVVEEAKKEPSARKSSKKLMIGPDVTSLIRRFVRKEDAECSFNFSKWAPRNVWTSVREEEGHFRYAVWVKSAFLTSVIVLIFTCMRTVSVLSNLSELYKENRDKFNSNLDELNTFLTNAGWTDGIESVVKTVVVELYLIADAVVLDLKYTSKPGYFLGLLFGLCGLVAVLIQHKRISLAVSEGLHAFRLDAAMHEQEIESPWPSFQKKYPILGACVFLAILSSTAVIQLHIVGLTASVLLGLLFNATKLSVLMDIFGFYMLAYVLVFVSDVIVMRICKKWLISADGAHINHPRWFNFIIVVLSMVHLCIGLLYALWRVLYLLVTTVVVLNRLDVSLFTTGKSLDNGHNAFMSMLVLTVLIQEDHDSFTIHDKSTHPAQ